MLRVTSRDRWFIDRVLPHAAAYRRQALRWAINAEAADEIVQEAYARVIGLRNWASVVAPRAYMMLAVRNIAIDRLRHARVIPFDRGGDAILADLVDEAPDAFDRVAAQRELDTVRAAIAELPAQCRRVVEMRKLDELSPGEIADRLGISVSTVEKHLVKGMRLVMRAVHAVQDMESERIAREQPDRGCTNRSDGVADTAGCRIG